jgi:hypothetical protein
MNRYKAAGIQINPEHGISRSQLFRLMFLINDDTYEIISFDADNTICYFLFSFTYYEEKIDGENLLRFKDKFIEIANNIKNETLDNIYNFDDDLIYFGY